MRSGKGKSWRPRPAGFLISMGGLLVAASSLTAQPQAQPELPPPYVPPAPANSAPPSVYVPPAPAPVVPAAPPVYVPFGPGPAASALPPAYVSPTAAQGVPAPPGGEAIGYPGQPAPPPGPSNLAVVEPGPPAPFMFIPRPRFDPNEPYRIWARADLLVWWVKNAPFDGAVVQTPNIATNPGTVITPGSLDYQTLAGFRFVMGGWFDSNNTIGMEAGFFTTEHVTRNYSYSSDANGNPTLAYPYVSQTPGFAGNYLMPISMPGQYAGNVLIAPSMQFWGAEINGALNIWRSAGMELTLLGGFRYANLQEGLLISGLSQFSDGSVMILNDNFNTRNQFYGGQLGARFGWQSDRFSVDVTGKLALGGNYETVDVQGNTFSNFGGNPTVTPGGFYAQQSNSGHFTGSQFAVMPAIELKLSYALSSRTRIYVGYDFMYWSQVVRPGSQVSSNINLSQSQSLGNGALSGPATPAPLFNRTDFWAQGITFGIEFRF